MKKASSAFMTMLVVTFAVTLLFRPSAGDAAPDLTVDSIWIGDAKGVNYDSLKVNQQYFIFILFKNTGGNFEGRFEHGATLYSLSPSETKIRAPKGESPLAMLPIGTGWFFDWKLGPYIAYEGKYKLTVYIKILEGPPESDYANNQKDYFFTVPGKLTGVEIATTTLTTESTTSKPESTSTRTVTTTPTSRSTLSTTSSSPSTAAGGAGLPPFSPTAVLGVVGAFVGAILVAALTVIRSRRKPARKVKWTCHQCGTVNDISSKYCLECGQAATDETRLWDTSHGK